MSQEMLKHSIFDMSFKKIITWDYSHIFGEKLVKRNGKCRKKRSDFEFAKGPTSQLHQKWGVYCAYFEDICDSKLCCDGLVQDCSNSAAFDLLQSRTKLSIVAIRK